MARSRRYGGEGYNRKGAGIVEEDANTKYQLKTWFKRYPLPAIPYEVCRFKYEPVSKNVHFKGFIHVFLLCTDFFRGTLILAFLCWL